MEQFQNVVASLNPFAQNLFKKENATITFRLDSIPAPCYTKYLCFVQTSGEVIDWQKTSLSSAGAGATCLKRGADFHSTPSTAF